MKHFLISIDTEGDNLWRWDRKSPITTENVKYLPRFQDLCNKYGFKPTYLTNYEMAMDSGFVDFAKRGQQRGDCEVGMHLHAWNNPPYYELPVRNDMNPGKPFLIEYPEEIMEQKISVITDLLEQRFECKPISHRAGRWATNKTYFELLNKYDYKADCSVTPLISWGNAPGQTQGSFGTDYSDYPRIAYCIPDTTLFEIPVTVKRDHRRIPNETGSIRKAWKLHKRARAGYGYLWLRPDGNNLKDMLYLAEQVIKSPKDDYLMFMLHSSEFMPGGSPTFDTNEKIEKLYNDLEVLFSTISKNFKGMSIGEYCSTLIK